MKKLLIIPATLLAACAGQQPAPQNPITYTCNGDLPTVTASYPDTDTAVVTLPLESSSPTRTLKITRAASGARYSTSSATPEKPGTLIWWTKGPEAILYLIVPAKPGQKYDYEKQLANCTSQPEPTPVGTYQTNPSTAPLTPLHVH